MNTLAEKVKWIEDQNVIKKLYFYPEDIIVIVVINYDIVKIKNKLLNHKQLFTDNLFYLNDIEPLIAIYNENLDTEVVLPADEAIVIFFKSGDNVLELYQKYLLLK